MKNKLYFGHDFAGAQSPPIRHAFIGALCKYLASEVGPQSSSIKVLEIGSWLGASAITWSKFLSLYFKKVNILCVDPWQPYFDLAVNTDDHYKLMDRLARENKLHKIFKHNMKVAKVKSNVKFKKGTSQEIAPNLKDNTFDVIYIDGSHFYKDVMFDIKQAKRLVKNGGIICGDDLEQQIQIVDIEQMNQAISCNQDYIRCKNTQYEYHPGVTKAVADEFGAKVSCSEGFWYLRVQDRDKYCNIDLPKNNLDLNIPEHIEVLPMFIESFHNYNIFKHFEGFCAINQSLGAVEINLNRNDLVSMYKAEDLFFCDSLATIKSNIVSLLAIEEPVIDD